MNDETEYKYKTLRLAVTAMRERQKTYFKLRDSRILRECKDLESVVDEMLK